MKALALRSGSPERVCESLYRRHVNDVYRYTLAMLDRPADAEDATQTTFMNAYRALERGERPRDSRSWLLAIALNVCREHFRRARRRPDEVPLDHDPGELVLDPPTPGIGDVVRGLSYLPFNQRAALVMREFEGRSLAEIAVALEVSASAAEALLFRARRALREQLEGALSCAEAEHALSRQLDGAVPRAERGPLRAHLRQCPDCASLARRLRAQRSAIRSLAAIPLPASLKLSQLFTGGAAGASAPAGIAAASAVSGGGTLLGSIAAPMAAKLAVAAIVGATAVGVGYASLAHKSSRPAGSPRPASSAEGGPSPGAAAAKLVGRGDTSAGSRAPSTTPEGRSTAALAAVGIHRRTPTATVATRTRATTGSVQLSARAPAGIGASQHKHGGVGARHHPISATPTKSARPTASGSGSGHPRPNHPHTKPHKPHPAAAGPPPSQTTTATPHAPNHGVGNGNGNGNSKHASGG